MSRGRCGTYAGYKAHIDAGTEPCEPCRAANVTRGAAWLRGNPDRRSAYQIQRRRRDKALRILGGRHQAELNGIVEWLTRLEDAGVPR